jgi:hypothetical protein
MNAIKLAQYLEVGRPTELELLGYLSKAAAELRRLASVEAELAALREQEPVAWQSKFTNDHDWSACSKEHAEWVKREPQQFIGYETRALYADPAPPAQPSGNSEQLPDWPEDRGEHPQKGLGVQS